MDPKETLDYLLTKDGVSVDFTSKPYQIDGEKYWLSIKGPKDNSIGSICILETAGTEFVFPILGNANESPGKGLWHHVMQELLYMQGIKIGDSDGYLRIDSPTKKELDAAYFLMSSYDSIVNSEPYQALSRDLESIAIELAKIKS